MDFIRNKDNTSRKYEYDFLGFFDSPDIRRYNSNTEFHPAEQAVLIARSKKRTVEEKIWALQYLAYTRDDLGEYHFFGWEDLSSEIGRNGRLLYTV